MKICVYGSGCKACKKLYDNTLNAVKENSVKAEIEYITDMKVIMTKGFMTMPVLEIDGKVVAKGKVLDISEIAELIKTR